MFQLNYGYFRVDWNRYKPVALKNIYRGLGYQLTKNVGHYDSMTKKKCRLKSFAMAINTFKICGASRCKFPL